MKKFVTLITYILLVITTFVSPINSSIFTLNMSNIVETEQADEPFVLQPTTIVLTELQNPDDLFTFAIDSSKKLTDRDRAQLTFDATLTDYLNKTQVLTLEDFNFDIEDNNQRIIYHLKSLKTQSDDYSNEIIATVSLLNDKLELSTYLYKAPNALKANGKTEADVSAALTPVYYNSSQGIQYPVYTKLKDGKNSFRRIINTLSNRPNYPGLPETVQFPYIGYVWYSAGTLELKMTSAQLSAFGDQSVAQSALYCLLNTVKHFSGDLVVNKVSLLIDDANSSRAFGDLDITEPFSVTRNPQVFLPLIQDGQTTWFPKDVVSGESVQDTVQQIVDAYQCPYGICERTDIAPLLAKTVEFQQANVVGNTLRLSFNEALAEYCKGHRDYSAALVEGLVLSATTLPDIDNIELYIDETKIAKLGDYTFANPIMPPQYFNVDLDYIK